MQDCKIELVLRNEIGWVLQQNPRWHRKLLQNFVSYFDVGWTGSSNTKVDADRIYYCFFKLKAQGGLTLPKNNILNHGLLLQTMCSCSHLSWHMFLERECSSIMFYIRTFNLSWLTADIRSQTGTQVSHKYIYLSHTFISTNKKQHNDKSTKLRLPQLFCGVATLKSLMANIPLVLKGWRYAVLNATDFMQIHPRTWVYIK